MTWDESKHPRHPAGSAQGGQFAPGDLVSFDHPQLGRVTATVVKADQSRVVTAWEGLDRDRKTGDPKIEFQVHKLSAVHKMAAKGNMQVTASMTGRATSLLGGVTRAPDAASKAMRQAESFARGIGDRAMSKVERQKLTNMTAKARTLTRNPFYKPSGKKVGSK